MSSKGTEKIKKNSASKAVAIRIFKNPMAIVGILLVIILCFAAVFAPILTQYSPTKVTVSDAFLTPSLKHFAGTDDLGRDIFSRIIYGCRVSLSVGIISQIIATVIGYTMGVCAGYFGGKVDSVISFLIQVFSSFPFLLFAMAIMFVLGPGLINLYLALGLLGWASTARLIRGDVMRLKKMEYIDACKVSGGNSFRIIMKHLLPNCLSTLIVTVTLGVPNAIMSEASLSFLGLGVKAPMASWGSMISFSQPYIRSATYYSVIPGLAIIITVLAFNMLGDGLRDALDPKLRS